MRKQRNFYLLKVEKNLFALFIGIEEKTEKEKKQRECFFLEKRRTEGKEERERGEKVFSFVLRRREKKRDDLVWF